jgi:hypothetical protein
MLLKKSLTTVCFFAVATFSQIHPALADGELIAQVVPVTPTNLPTEVISTTQVNQQPGIVQVGNGNWAGSSNLSTPNCPTGCIYVQGRSYPSATGTPNWEATAGVLFQLGSPDNGNAEISRLNLELQKYKTKNELIAGLSRELSDAIESNKMPRARLIAIILAPEIGYKRYEDLLIEMSKKNITFNSR